MESATIISRANPYVGPRPFKKGEELYGRERETSEITDILTAERIILLYSPSGAGKSSLLNAAILPHMEQNGFRVLPVTRVNLEPPKGAEKIGGFNRYIHSLVHSLETIFAEGSHADHKTLLGLRFSNYLRAFRERCQQTFPDFDPAQPTVIVFDQLEEIFTINPTDRPQKLDFFVQLGEVLRDRNIWAIFSIREDYTASLDPYLRPIPTQLATRYRLNMLESEAAVDAIRKPAEAMGVIFDEEAAHKLVDDLRMVRVQQADGNTEEVPGAYIQAVQLQVVCRRLWAKLSGKEEHITLDTVLSAGDVSSALADYYSVQVAIVASETDVTERAIREWFDRKLITVQGVRGQVLMAPNASEGLDNRAIWRLEQAYLVRAEKRGGATWFELSHDRLLRPIRENNGHWFEANLSPLQRQADVWNSSGRIEGMLLVDKDLENAEKWAAENKNVLIPVEVDFLGACRQLNARLLTERRNNRIIQRLFIIAVLAFVIAGVLFVRASLAEQKAVARERAADAVNNLIVDPELSVMLSLTSLQSTINPLAESIQSLHLTLPQIRVEHILQKHTDKVYSVVYSPDGNSLASAGAEGKVIIWSAGGDWIKTLDIYPDNDQKIAITNVAYNPVQPLLYATDKAGKVWIYDTETWQLEAQVNVTTKVIWGLAVSPDGTLVAIGAEDHTARILDAVSGKTITTLGQENCIEVGKGACRNGHTATVETVAFSPDGSLLATAGDDLSIRIWSPSSGSFIEKFSGSGGHEYLINSIAFSPDGTTLASASADRSIKLWSVATGNVLMTIQTVNGSAGHVDWVYDVAFTSDGKSIISSSSDRTVRVWDTTYGRLQETLNGHTSQVFALAISPDGKHVATSSEDTTVRIWNFWRSGTVELATMDNQDKVYDADFSPDGTLIASGGRELAVRIWDPKTGEKIKEMPGGNTRPIESVSWSPDGNTIAAAGRDGKVILWDWRADPPVSKVLFDNNGTAAWRAMNYSPDGRAIAFGGDDTAIHVIDSTSGQEIHTLEAGNSDDTLRKDLATLKAQVFSIAFSADGKYLAVGYATPALVTVWDWQAEKLLYVFRDHTDYVQGVIFSPVNSNILATVSDDGILFIYNLAAKTKMAGTGHLGTIYDVDFSADGRRIVTAGGDGVVKVWDASTANVLLNLYGHTNRVLTAEFDHADSTYVVSGSEDFTIRTYTLDIKELMALAESRLTGTILPETCARLGILSKYCIQP